LAIAIVLKGFPAIFLLVLLIHRSWGVLLWALAILAGICLVTLLFLPWSFWEQWWKLVGGVIMQQSSITGLFTPDVAYNQGLNGLFARLFQPGEMYPGLWNIPIVARICYGISSLGLLGGVFWATYKMHNRSAQSKGITTSWVLLGTMVLTIMILVTPYAWIHHQVMLLPGLGYLICWVIKNRHRLQHGILRLMVLFGLAFPFPFWTTGQVNPRFQEFLVPNGHIYMESLLINLKVVLMLLLVGMLWGDLRKIQHGELDRIPRL